MVALVGWMDGVVEMMGDVVCAAKKVSNTIQTYSAYVYSTTPPTAPHQRPPTTASTAYSNADPLVYHWNDGNETSNDPFKESSRFGFGPSLSLTLFPCMHAIPCSLPPLSSAHCSISPRLVLLSPHPFSLSLPLSLSLSPFPTSPFLHIIYTTDCIFNIHSQTIIVTVT
jgi:hypothetical protein